jgi:hypothetical protein
MVVACPENSEATRPTNCKVVVFREARPFSTCVTIVNHPAPSRHVRFAPVQVLAPPFLLKEESILPEKGMAINCTMLLTSFSHAVCAHNSPPISRVGAFVPEDHPSVTSSLKHLEPNKAPSSAKLLVGLSIAHAVQAVVVDCVPIVNPQLAAIIGDNTESVTS